MKSARALLVVVAVGCGGNETKKPPRAPASDKKIEAAPVAKKEEPAKPEPYRAAAWSGDVVMRWVRPERSSRLAQVLPKGRARETWSASLDTLEPELVMTAGTRIVVGGRDARYAIFDTKGIAVSAGSLDGDRFRIDPSTGTLSAGGRATRKLADGSDGIAGDATLDLAPGAHDAEYGESTVYATANSLEVREGDTQRVRQIVQGAFEPLDLAVDGDGVINVIVRQGSALSMWITPVRGGSIGRVKLPPGKREKANVPPILGRAMKAVVYDDRLVAIGPEGKTLFERKGALTGGVTITADDRLLVASDDRLTAVDASGKATELATIKGVVFATPPILGSGAVLLVASRQKLHAFAVEP